MNELQMDGIVSPAGVVDVDGEYVTLRYERYLDHSPETVWDALTDPEQLGSWLMATTATVDGRVGGSVDMVAGVSQFHWTGAVLAWDPPHLYEHEWNLDPRPEVPAGEATIVRWELQPSGTGTILNVTHSRLTRPTGLGFGPGFHALLDRLAAQLDGSPLPNWTKRYDEVRGMYPSWSAEG